jgi:L,D-peptidoglycan transpeptidase YkuD (ErfK/YbiS/YcfS/YnhG family)
MAFSGKGRIIGLLTVLLVLLLGVGAYELWLCLALRYHPWQLEASVKNLTASCRTGPGAYAFSEELRALASQVAEADVCLNRAREAWAIGRDYTPCYQLLLRTSLTALRIRMNQMQRIREQKIRLSIFIKTLEFELNNDALARRTGARFEVKHLAQSQARTMLDAARNLDSLGQTESALIAAMRARAAWEQSENFRAAELARFYDARYRTQWEKAAQDLLRWTKQTGRSAILVDKLGHRCLLLANGRVERSYAANLGRNWYRMKVQEHDASTPEGEYRIRSKFRSSSFGWALLLDYPNAADSRRFDTLKKMGDISVRARIGGNIEIHGGGRLNSDWTDGCVSLENPDMADLYKRAYAGMPVTIVGTSSLGASMKE